MNPEGLYRLQDSRGSDHYHSFLVLAVPSREMASLHPEPPHYHHPHHYHQQHKASGCLQYSGTKPRARSYSTYKVHFNNPSPSPIHKSGTQG